MQFFKFKNSFLVKKQGFTLIELLVVVAIIGVLSSVVLTSLNSARGKARDARRLSDVQQIAKAFYLASNADNGLFPATPLGAVCLGTLGTCWDIGGTIKSGNATVEAFLQPYLAQIPVDPSRLNQKGDRYLYVDGTKDVSGQCTGLNMVKGPIIIWVPDKLSPSSDTDCKNASFVACCGSAMVCLYGYYCAYKL